jgi:hypothetical protein
MPFIITALSQATDALCTLGSIFVQIIGQRNQLMANFGRGQGYCSILIQNSKYHQVIFKIDHCLQGGVASWQWTPKWVRHLCQEYGLSTAQPSGRL